jgi:hypothetical protein
MTLANQMRSRNRRRQINAEKPLGLIDEIKKDGAHSRIRTDDLPLTRRLLYP